MIDICERITRVTTNSDPISSPWPEWPARSRVAKGARAPTGARVTLEFTRSAPVTAGQEVRLRYDFMGNGHFVDCVGIPQPTHIVARVGQQKVFHYRLSHWLTPSALLLLKERHA